MSCDEFDMSAYYSSWRQRVKWEIKAKDGDMKIELSVEDDDIQECISDNFDYLIDTLGKELTYRVENMKNLGQITDEEKAVFDKIMLMVIE